MHIISQEQYNVLDLLIIVFFTNYFDSQDDIVTLAILRLQICKRTRDT